MKKIILLFGYIFMLSMATTSYGFEIEDRGIGWKSNNYVSLIARLKGQI